MIIFADGIASKISGQIRPIEGDSDFAVVYRVKFSAGEHFEVIVSHRAKKLEIVPSVI